MNAGLAIALVSLIGVIATAAFTYLSARRKSSGSIDTTEAETLWAQTNELLNRYKVDLGEARAEAVALRMEIVELRTVIAQCRHEAKTLATEVARKLAADVAERLAVEVAHELAAKQGTTEADVNTRRVAENVARRLADKVLSESAEEDDDA